MFIDETGEANVTNSDPRYNLFSLCGIMISEVAYKSFNAEMMNIKSEIFGREDVVFHSFDMRRRKGTFKLFEDLAILNEFYLRLNKLINNHEYYILSAIINKELYRETYPEKNFAYEESLEFILERAFYIQKKKGDCQKLLICIEERSKDKNRLVKKHYNQLLEKGNRYYSNRAFSFCHKQLFFRKKADNVNGLQFADLCAYPIARAICYPQLKHPTFEAIKHKIYCSTQGNIYGFGVKVFPVRRFEVDTEGNEDDDS